MMYSPPLSPVFLSFHKVAVMRSCSELEELYRRHLDGDEPEKTEGEENTETEGQGTGE